MTSESEKYPADDGVNFGRRSRISRSTLLVTFDQRDS